MRDPDYEDLLPLLSVPAEVHDPGLAGVTRRRFLQGTLATAGAVTLGATRWAKEAFASPIAASDGVLVMVMLGGGNDGLNAFAPISGTDRSRYQTLRGGLAIPAARCCPPPRATASTRASRSCQPRYAAGRVAVVRGVGQPANDLSHFTLHGDVHGRHRRARPGPSGWLGRYLDGVSEFDSGMRGITFSSSVPLHLLGTRAKVTAVPDQGGMWGSDITERFERSAFAAVEAFASAPTGLSAWGDKVAANGKAAIGMAADDRRALPPRAHHRRARARPHARRPARQRRPRRPGHRRERRRLGHALGPALRPRRAARRARRRHRGVLHHPRPRLPRPDHPGHVLRVRPPPGGQRQRAAPTTAPPA